MLEGTYVDLKNGGAFDWILNGARYPIRAVNRQAKAIHMFWHSGFDKAPDLVKYCIESWYERNPGWEVRFLAQDEANHIVNMDSLPKGIMVSHYADILRLKLLAQNGGVWADATCYCTRSLDDWLPLILLQSDFFAFSRPSKKRLIANWFLAANKGSMVIDRWLTASERFWASRTEPSNCYWWHHYLLEWQLLSSISFRREWRKMPKIGVDSARTVSWILDNVKLGARVQRENIDVAPMQKLSHKKGYTVDAVHRVLG